MIHCQISAIARAGTGLRQELDPGTPHEWQGLKYLSHDLLSPRVHFRGKLKSWAELGLEPRHSALWCRYPKHCLNCYAKCPPLLHILTCCPICKICYKAVHQDIWKRAITPFLFFLQSKNQTLARGIWCCYFPHLSDSIFPSPHLFPSAVSASLLLEHNQPASLGCTFYTASSQDIGGSCCFIASEYFLTCYHASGTQKWHYHIYLL